MKESCHPLVSVIIPLFNKERYIGRCLSSVLDKGLGEHGIEIVVVDDGSTDSSLAKCREYVSDNECVRILTQPNNGAWHARNTGIDAARGKYVCFVDADDVLAPGGLSSILHLCDGKTDVVRFWCQVNSGGKTQSGEESDGQVYFRGSGREWILKYGLETFCVNCLFRKEFLDSRGIRFQKGILGEDFMFMYDVLMAVENMVSVRKDVYLYNLAEGSITCDRSKEHNRKCERDFRNILNIISGRTEEIRSYDLELWKACRLSIDFKVVNLFSRILSADYALDEYKTVIADCKRSGLIPLRFDKQLSCGMRLAHAAIKKMVAMPCSYLVAKPLFKLTCCFWR